LLALLGTPAWGVVDERGKGEDGMKRVILTIFDGAIIVIPLAIIIISFMLGFAYFTKITLIIWELYI
jgi:hypothetical protein